MFIYRPGYTKWYTLLNVPIKHSNLSQITKKQTRVIENKDGDTISEDTEIEKRWTEYCNNLYNYPINPDKNTLINREVEVSDNLLILKSEVENAIKNLKKSKATGVDNIPGELFIND